MTDELSPAERELCHLAKELLRAVEWSPEYDCGILTEHTVNRYFETIERRERHSAEWFYRKKLSFEFEYENDFNEDDNSEPAWVSDNGQGAKTHYALASHRLDGWRKDPFWLVLFRRKRLELKPKHRKILDALALDWRSKVAARIAGSDPKTVRKAKKIFKVHFAQCYQAWKRDFAF